MSFSATGVASTPILILIEGCCGLGVRARGAFGFSNEKSFTYCINTPICGAVCGAPGCGAGPPFVVDIVTSACAGLANMRRSHEQCRGNLVVLRPRTGASGGLLSRCGPNNLAVLLANAVVIV